MDPRHRHDSGRPLPDILRPTEICDFGELFRRSPRPARTIVALLIIAGAIAWAHVGMRETTAVANGPQAMVELDRH